MMLDQHQCWLRLNREPCVSGMFYVFEQSLQVKQAKYLYIENITTILKYFSSIMSNGC